MNYDIITSLGNEGGFVVMDVTEVTPIQETYKRLSSEEDCKLLWAAFDLADSSFWRFPDANPDVSLQWKPNKTFDEWVELLTTKGDFDFFTSSRDGVLRQFLAEYNPESRWNNDGFLMKVARSGVEYRIFFGYTRAEHEVPDNIRRKIIEAREHPDIKRVVLAQLARDEEDRQRVYSGVPWKEVYAPGLVKHKREMANLDLVGALLKGKGVLLGETGQLENEIHAPVPKVTKTYCLSLRKDSNLVLMPRNAHTSYITAGKEVADMVMNCDKSTDSSKNLAAGFIAKLEGKYFYHKSSS